MINIANIKNITLNKHVQVLSACARFDSIYNYIIIKYLVKSYANIFLFLLAQMTKASDLRTMFIRHSRSKINIDYLTKCD